MREMPNPKRTYLLQTNAVDRDHPSAKSRFLLLGFLRNRDTCKDGNVKQCASTRFYSFYSDKKLVAKERYYHALVYSYFERIERTHPSFVSAGR